MSGTAYNVCPRCGEPISYIERRRIRGRVYIYAVHYYGYERGPDGKPRPKLRKCYLGPEKYILVNRLLATAGLQVKLLAVSQLEEMAKAVEEKMARTEMSAYTAQQLADRLQGLADRLRKYAEERAKAEAEARKAASTQGTEDIDREPKASH